MIGFVLRAVAVTILLAVTLVPHASYALLPHTQPSLGASASEMPAGTHIDHETPANGSEHTQHSGAAVLACVMVCAGANQHQPFAYGLPHNVRSTVQRAWPRTALLAQTIGKPGERPPRASAVA